MTSMYVFLAGVILLAHFAFVLFVVVGFALVVLGGWLGWSWIRNSWFRTLHLISIAIVAGQSWFSIVCPLTTLEMWLRNKAGESAYEGSFIQYWLQELLYYDASAWIFVVAYSSFGLLVVFAIFVYPPNFMRRGNTIGT